MRRSFPIWLVASLALVPLSACVIHLDNGGTSFVSIEESGNFKAERTVDLPLSISAGRKLAAATKSGEIVVRADSGASANVHARLRAGGETEEQAHQVLERYSVELVDTADGVSVEIKGEPLEVKSTFGTRKYVPRIDLEIVVPDGVAFEGRTGSGDIGASGALGNTVLASSYGKIAANGTRGSLDARTSSGSVDVRDIRGDVVAKSSYGAVALADVDATTISVSSSSGEVKLENARAQSSELKTSYGNVRVARTSGTIDARSSSGTVVGEDLDGATIELRSGYGKVAAHRVKGALTLHSSSGDIDVDGANGSLDANTSYGSVSARGVFTLVTAKSSSGRVSINALAGSSLTNDWSVSSGYGSVALALPDGVACTLDAQTSYGSASCDFPLTIEAGYKAKNGRIAGAINGGGPTIKLRSSSGDVNLKKLAN